LPRGFAYQRVDEALEKASAYLSPPRAVDLPTLDSYGYVLAEDLRSPSNLPPMATAFVDGYAVRSEDLVAGRAILKLVKTTCLGEVPDFGLGRGEACWVPTGGYVPRGADAVVMVERTSRLGESSVRVDGPVRPGENIIPPGSDFREGEVFLTAGGRLRSQDVGILNMLGIEKVRVFPRPKVGTISVGTELVDSPSELAPGKVLASHRYVIGRMAEADGGVWNDYGIVSDDEAEIKQRLKSALAECDLVLTIGGTSMGEADLMPEAVNALGEPGMVVHGIKVQPGRPTGLGIVGGKPVVILPGLLQSAILGYFALAGPALRRLSHAGEQVPYTWLPIDADLTFTRFLDFQKATFVKLTRRRDGIFVQPIESISYYNNVLLKADGFTITPENVSTVKKGDLVKVFLPPGFGRIPF